MFGLGLLYAIPLEKAILQALTAADLAASSTEKRIVGNQRPI